MRTLALTALVVLSTARLASAASYYVAPTGDDAAAGTSAAPWKTIQKAAGKVVAGDTVTVRDGTYGGFACDGKHGTAAARIVFKAENKGGAKITSAGVGANAQDFIQLSSCSYVTVDGFEVSGAPRSGIAILGNEDDGSDARDVIIQNNHSHHNGAMKVAGRHDGIFSGFAMNLTIQDNESHDNSEHGIYVSNAADNPIIRRNHSHDVGLNCIQINADLSTGGDGIISNWLIERNVVHGCGSAGFNLDGVVNGTLQNNLAYDCVRGGITLFQGDGAQASHDNLVVNNTIFNPNGSRAALQVASGANNNVVFNNILYAPKAVGLEIQTVTGLVHDYNFVSNFSGGSASAHEASPDPATLFVDVTGRQLALAATSPALDSGVATLGGKQAPTVDNAGAARPAGGGTDRGAFEGGKSGTPTPPTTTPDAGTSGGAGSSGGAAGAGVAGNGGNAGSTGAAGATAGAAGTGAAGATTPTPTTGAAGAPTPPSGSGQAGVTGTSGADAATTPGATSSGGGCRVAGGGAPSKSAAGAVALALTLVLIARRQRRR